MDNLKLSKSQQHVMDCVNYNHGCDTYIDIGRYKWVKSIRTIKTLVKLGQIDIIEIGDGWVCVKSHKEIPHTK